MDPFSAIIAVASAIFWVAAGIFGVLVTTVGILFRILFRLWHEHPKGLTVAAGILAATAAGWYFGVRLPQRELGLEVQRQPSLEDRRARELEAQRHRKQEAERQRPDAAPSRKLADLSPFSASVPSGFTCRPEVTVTVRAPEESAFGSNRVELQKLIGGVRAIFGFECPNTTITNLLIVGEAGGRQVYRGSASGRTSWLLTDIRTPPAASAPGQ